jgi:hypothetical protein
MHRFRKAVITGFFGLALMGAGQSQAFSFGDSSFSFGDDDWGGWGPGYGDPYRGYRGYGYDRGYRGYPGRNWRGPGWNRGYGPSFSNPWNRGDRRYFPRYRNYNPRMSPPPPPPNAPGGCPAETAPAQ